jgi:hypothetical protein
VKRRLDSVADKENILCSRDNEQAKFANQLSRYTEYSTKGSTTKKTTRPPSRVLQLKINNTSQLLHKHPVSQHITKSNLYSDENWIGMQQQLFTSILNEVLGSQFSGPNTWKFEILKDIRKIAFEYYQKEAFQIIVKRLNTVSSSEHHKANIFKAFNTKRLTLVDKTQCFQDVGLRSAVKDLLCGSYTSTWLVIGMELVTGRICAPLVQESGHSLSNFIDSVFLYLLIN